MANTCTTDYIFEGEGAQIRALHSELEKIAKAKPKCTDYHDWHIQSNWLGYVAEKVLGLDSEKISCRGEFNLGEIDNCPYDDNLLTLGVSAYTAWSPCTELFEKLAEKYDCKLYWIAEELGCELFQSNDSDEKYFHDTIIVDTDDEGSEYFSDWKDALEFVQNKVDNKNLTWEQIDGLDGINLYQVDYV